MNNMIKNWPFQVWPDVDSAKGLSIKIRLEGPMFDFSVYQDQKNVSNWVDWSQFATLEDSKGNPVQLQDVPELPGLAIRLVCTPAGKSQIWIMIYMRIIR